MPWYASIVSKDTPHIKYAFFPQPRSGDSQRYWGLTQVWMHGVSKKAVGKEGLWRFMDYLLKPDVAARWSAFSGELSSVKASVKDSKVTESPFLKDFVPLMQYGVAQDLVEWLSTDVNNAIINMFESTKRQQAPPDQALKAAVEEINRVTARLAR
jgi:ABC-type glycerol-3-phosphate transport system substrate-binding protein